MKTKPLLLDGSMGQEIVNRGGKSGYGEWAISALLENPEIITEIHLDYLKAGADIITTNTYSTSRTRLNYRGIEDQLEDLVNLAGSLAQSARQEAQTGDSHIQIAGSIGPLEGSYLSEFTLSYDEMVTQFDELMTLLDPYVDIYLGETFATILEARAFLTATKNHAKTTWVSWTLKDHGSSQLRSGEDLSDAIGTIESFGLDAILLNCCTPNSIDASIDILKQSQIAFGGYANGFVEVPSVWISDGDVEDQVKRQTELTPPVYADHANHWINRGASVVGGCCDIGPKHIARLRQMIDTL